MDQRDVEQLAKILALADSEHEGEALASLRMARQLLAREGLTFVMLARAASDLMEITWPQAMFAGMQARLGGQIAGLQREILDLQNELRHQATQAEVWRRRALDLEPQLAQAQAEQRRWQQVAKEAVETLWDVSRTARAEEFVSDRSALDKSPHSDRQAEEKNVKRRQRGGRS